MQVWNDTPEHLQQLCNGRCSHIPEYLLNLVTKLEEKENDGNPLTDSPEIVPSISVAARVVQVGSSSNEQGQSKEQHTNSIHHEGKAKTARTCNDVTTVCKDDCTISSCTVEWKIFMNRNFCESLKTSLE